MASPVPSPPGSQPGFRHAAGEGGGGASCPRSRRQAAEMHGLAGSPEHCANPGRDAARAPQMFPLNVWHRCPGQEPWPRHQHREGPLPSGRLQLGLPGPLLQRYSGQGPQAGGSPPTPQDASSGCPLWCCVRVAHRPTRRARGTKLVCVTQGDGGATAWAALGCWSPVRGPGDQELGVGGAVERGSWLPKPRKSWKT